MTLIHGDAVDMSAFAYARGAAPDVRARLRSSPADFFVDEDCDIALSGSGEHLWCRIEKTGLNTQDAVQALEHVRYARRRASRKRQALYQTGTGVSGRAAVHHARGELSVGETITIESLLGTTFDVEIARTCEVGSLQGVIPRVTGSAHVTGCHEFLIDPADPLRTQTLHCQSAHFSSSQHKYRSTLECSEHLACQGNSCRRYGPGTLGNRCR